MVDLRLVDFQVEVADQGVDLGVVLGVEVVQLVVLSFSLLDPLARLLAVLRRKQIIIVRLKLRNCIADGVPCWKTCSTEHVNAKQRTAMFHTGLIFIVNEDVDKKTFLQNVY